MSLLETAQRNHDFCVEQINRCIDQVAYYKNDQARGIALGMLMMAVHASVINYNEYNELSAKLSDVISSVFAEAE